MSADALLAARGLTKRFAIGGRGRRGGGFLGGPQRFLPAVRGVDFDVRAGETLALVGESGSGKTTVGRIVARLVEPDSGSIAFEGEDWLSLSGAALRRRRRDLQVVFQDPQTSLNPRLRVGDQVAEPLRVQRLVRREDLAARVGELLASVGLAAETAGLAYLFIAHDLAVVSRVADTIAVMYLGRIVEQGPGDAVLARPRHPYTVALLAAVPVADPQAPRPSHRLAGEPPSAVDPPSGCAFHPRCPIARPRCREETPSLVEEISGRSVACFYPGEMQ